MNYNELQKVYMETYNGKKKYIINAYTEACKELTDSQSKGKSIQQMKNKLTFKYPTECSGVIDEDDVKDILFEEYNIPKSKVSNYFTSGHGMQGRVIRMISIDIN